MQSLNLIEDTDDNISHISFKNILNKTNTHISNESITDRKIIERMDCHYLKESKPNI